jgi:hypothetical protein
VLAVCAAGIAGMIAGSIADNNAMAMTFGLATAVAVLCLMVATAVVGPPVGTPPDEAQAARVEGLAADLTAAGADGALVRSLVRESVRLGRTAGRE